MFAISICIVFGKFPIRAEYWQQIPQTAILLDLRRNCNAICTEGWNFMLAGFSLLAGLPALTLLVIQVRNISRNLTTNETFNKDKYAYLKNDLEQYHNPFDNGCIRNWQQMCCGDSPILSLDKSAV